MRTSQHSRHSDSSVPAPRRQNASPRRQLPAGPTDKRNGPRDVEAGLDPALLSKTPILCNKYAMDPQENNSNHLNPGDGRNHRRGASPLPGKGGTLPLPGRGASPLPGRRAVSMPRSPAYLAPPREMSPHSSREDLDSVKMTSRRKRASPSRKLCNGLFIIVVKFIRGWPLPLCCDFSGHWILFDVYSHKVFSVNGYDHYFNLSLFLTFTFCFVEFSLWITYL